jgi:hypothetical protein
MTLPFQSFFLMPSAADGSDFKEETHRMMRQIVLGAVIGFAVAVLIVSALGSRWSSEPVPVVDAGLVNVLEAVPLGTVVRPGPPLRRDLDQMPARAIAAPLEQTDGG